MPVGEIKTEKATEGFGFAWLSARSMGGYNKWQESERVEHKARTLLFIMRSNNGKGERYMTSVMYFFFTITDESIYH